MTPLPFLLLAATWRAGCVTETAMQSQAVSPGTPHLT